MSRLTEQLLECMEVEQADYLRALGEALDWLADASQLYLAGTPAVRRQLNLANLQQARCGA